MSNTQSFKIGDKITLNDLADAPEGSWIVRESMQFMRAQSGHSIISLTPIEGGTVPADKTPDRFTLVYAGNPKVEKSSAVAEALNTL